MSEDKQPGADQTDPNIPTVDKDAVPNPLPAVEDKPKELSRREKEAKKREEAEAKEKETARRLEELEKDNEFVRTQRLEQETLGAMKTYGLTSSDVDQEAFNDEVEKLKSDGLSQSKAIDLAMRLQTATKKEEETKEQIRKDATLPPASISIKQAPVVGDKYPQLSKAEYMGLLNKKRQELGNKKGMEYVTAYNDWQASKGRASFSE